MDEAKRPPTHKWEANYLGEFDMCVKCGLMRKTGGPKVVYTRGRAIVTKDYIYYKGGCDKTAHHAGEFPCHE